MSLNREIDAIKKRLARVAPIAKPPKLSLNEIESKPPLIENSPIQGEI